MINKTGIPELNNIFQLFPLILQLVISNPVRLKSRVEAKLGSKGVFLCIIVRTLVFQPMF